MKKYLLLLLIAAVLIITFVITRLIAPSKSIEYTLIVGLAAAVFALGKDYITSQGKQGFLTAQIDLLKEKMSEMKNKNIEFEKENLVLKEQVSTNAHKDKLLSDYVFIQDIGVFKHKTSGAYFCANCFIKDGLISPVSKNRGASSWHCAVCDKYYVDESPRGHNEPGYASMD